MSKSNLQSYISETNRKHVEAIALKNNRSMSEFIDELITAHRRKRPVKFEPKVTYLEKQAKQREERRKKKLKDLR